MAESCQPTFTALRGLRLSALLVLGGYSLAVGYRVGLFRRLLRPQWSAALDGVVTRIQAHTEPMGDPRRFALARRHLIQAYLWASAGVCATVTGSALFYAMPYLPVVLPVATTLMPAALVLALPRSLLRHSSRVFCFCLTWLSVGYVMGPLVWVAQDSLLTMLTLTGCTFIGLTVPLFLTRGMISYVASAQLLSCALALALVTTPHQSSRFTLVRAFRESAGVRIFLNADINVLLTLQLLSTVGINALHTVPTIWRYVFWRRSSSSSDKAEMEEQKLVANADPLFEAFCIDAGWLYVMYRSVRALTRVLIRRVLPADVVAEMESRGRTRGHHGSPNELQHGKMFHRIWHTFSKSHLDIHTTSGVVSGLVLCLWYIKTVSYLQRSDPTRTLNVIRRTCATLSPLRLLLVGRGGLQNLSAPCV